MVSSAAVPPEPESLEPPPHAAADRETATMPVSTAAARRFELRAMARLHFWLHAEPSRASTLREPSQGKSVYTLPQQGQAREAVTIG
ncbi:hypothetical protein BN10_990013 [Phycicoccus elongatus Lp2]|uniref:Uncharacterized protein n=1 Tax=Phycicoccus elongatus Lp2 TaxID=1193181 RepID=N0E3J5_9MICO|nr:hypothetical protein BN10_990013 [Phycicoccus elongatus Lp2]